MFYVHCSFAQFINSGTLSDYSGISRDNYIIMMRDLFFPPNLYICIFLCLIALAGASSYCETEVVIVGIS